MRADGGAANKGAATSCTSTSTAMSVTVHNSQSFSAGDRIFLCTDGGDYTDTLTPLSSGSSGNLIQYAGANDETAIFHLGTTTPKFAINAGAGRSYLSFSNISIIQDSGTSAVAGFSPNSTYSDFTVTGTNMVNGFIVRGDNITVQNSSVSNASNGVAVNSGTGVIIDNLDIDQSSSAGVNITSSSASITATVRNSTFQNNQTGITVNTSSGNTVVATSTNNIVEYSSGDGISVNGNAVLKSLKDISRYNGDSSGLSVGDGWTAHDTGTLNIEYGLGYGNEKSGVAVTGGSSGEILNSTFYSNTESTFGSGWDSAGDVGIGINATGTWAVKNNITHGHQVEMMVTQVAVAGGASVLSDNNLFFDSLGGLAFDYNGTLSNFAAYVSASSLDGSSLNVDPKFVNTSSSNFQLQSDSAAINAGTSTSGSDSDLLGNSIFGLRDMGAYEYQLISPTSAFTSSISGLSVDFTDTSTDSDGTISSWSWDFGDGETSTTQNPTHEYTSDGSYTVTLIATDNHGATSTANESISVSPSSGPSGGYIVPKQSSSLSREALIARITELQALLSKLKTGAVGAFSKASCTFTRNLQLHSDNDEVRCLQQYLNNNGFTVSESGDGSVGLETTYFGQLTFNALIRFQDANSSEILAPVGLTKGSGYFGSSTREFINNN